MLSYEVRKEFYGYLIENKIIPLTPQKVHHPDKNVLKLQT